MNTTDTPAAGPFATLNPGDFPQADAARDVSPPAGVTQKTAAANKPGMVARAKAAALFPFVWLAATFAQTVRGIALIAVMVSLAAFGGAVLYDMYLAPTASVTFRHGEVKEKGWFANLLWRNDSSKTFKVQTNKSFINGTDAEVTATRANGEVTILGNDGFWHMLMRKK